MKVHLHVHLQEICPIGYYPGSNHQVIGSEGLPVSTHTTPNQWGVWQWCTWQSTAAARSNPGMTSLAPCLISGSRELSCPTAALPVWRLTVQVYSTDFYTPSVSHTNPFKIVKSLVLPFSKWRGCDSHLGILTVSFSLETIGCPGCCSLLLQGPLLDP